MHLLRLFARALRLRCPRCGGGRLFASWFRMTPHCPRCALPFDRREGEDYFLGGMMVNIALAELVYAAGLASWIIATWPTPPWALLEYVGVPFMILAPVLFYPWSRSLWLAGDLAIRPAAREEPQLTPAGGARR